MIKNKDSVFVGAIVEKGDKEYNVYKVNKTTMWVGEQSIDGVMDTWKNRPKGYKWTDFMKRIEAFKVKYEEVTFNAEKSKGRKGLYENGNKAKKSSGARIKSCCKRKLHQPLEAYKNGRSYRYPLQCTCGKNICVIEKKEDEFIIRVGYDYVFYNPETDTEKFYKSVGD